MSPFHFFADPFHKPQVREQGSKIRSEMCLIYECVFLHRALQVKWQLYYEVFLIQWPCKYESAKFEAEMLENKWAVLVSQCVSEHMENLDSPCVHEEPSPQNQGFPLSYPFHSWWSDLALVWFSKLWAMLCGSALGPLCYNVTFACYLWGVLLSG